MATGFALLMAGQAIIPFDSPIRYISGDDKTFRFNLGIEIDTGLTMQGYNTDVFPHTFYLTFELDDLALTDQRSTGVIVPITAIG